MMISSNDLYEYHYCPREVYFMKKLGLPSQKRKMQLGREEQQKEVKRLSEREDIFGIQRTEILHIEHNKYLESKELELCGIMDCLLTLKSGEKIPVDIKYTDYAYITQGRAKQIIAYALLLDKNYGCRATKGIIYYPKQNARDVINITQEDKKMLLLDLIKIKNILISDKLPRKTSYKKCKYCGYLKVCGSFD